MALYSISRLFLAAPTHFYQDPLRTDQKAFQCKTAKSIPDVQLSHATVPVSGSPECLSCLRDVRSSDPTAAALENVETSVDKVSMKAMHMRRASDCGASTFISVGFTTNGPPVGHRRIRSFPTSTPTLATTKQLYAATPLQDLASRWCLDTLDSCSTSGYSLRTLSQF